MHSDTFSMTSRLIKLICNVIFQAFTSTNKHVTFEIYLCQNFILGT